MAGSPAAFPRQREEGSAVCSRRVSRSVALLLYNVLFPGSHQLTTREVNDTVAQALASATPPPAFSERVYQAIQPSLVLIQIKAPDANGKVEDSLGSGVVIDDSGDILTALHVVTNAADIQLTFADGTQSSAQVTVRQPENDTAVLRADQPPAHCARHAGKSERHARRRRGVCRRQSLWAVRLDERGCHFRL